MPRRWDKSKPPRGPWVLNEDALQAQGLLVWIPLNAGASAGKSQYDYAGRRNLHATSGSGLVASARDKWGAPAVVTNGSTDYFLTPLLGTTFLQTSKWMAFVSGTQKFTWGNWKRGTSPGWEVGEHFTGGKASMIVADGSAANYYGAEETASSADGFAHDYLFVHDGSAAAASRVSLWRDGTSTAVTSRTLGTSNPGTLVDNGMSFARSDGSPASYRTGTISDLRVYDTIDMAAAIAESISDPATRFELYYPLRSRRWITFGSSDPALTNNLATTASGILVPALSLAVTGNSATASRGTPVAALSLATTGNAATASPGTPVASISLALTGQGATSSAGSVGVGGTTQAITGNAATASAGTATPALSKAVTGNAATSAVGAVTPALSKAITGNAATSSAGTPVAAISLALTGQGATASAGTVAVPGLVVPTGVAATASQGSVSPGITVALTGNAVTASRGTVSPAISLALAGLAGTSAAGIVVPGLSKALTGNSATSAAGSALPATGNITLALTGNSATATAGTLGVDQGVDSTWWMYTVPADDLTYSVAADDLTYGVGPDQLPMRSECDP